MFASEYVNPIIDSIRVDWFTICLNKQLVTINPVTAADQAFFCIPFLITCKNADRIFYGTNKKAVILDLEARIKLEDIMEIYGPPAPKKYKPSKFGGNDDLDRLKVEFDLFGYMQEHNGELKFNNAKCAMFKHCELCGHNDDLVYYHDKNTFMCFGAGCNKGGSIIDYLVLSEGLNRKQAIDRLYELCGVEKPSLSKEQKRDYAIQKRTHHSQKLFDKLCEIKPAETLSLNDKAFGGLFADVFKDWCRFNVTAKEWYYYNGKIWQKDTGGMRVMQCAKQLADALLVYSTTLEESLQKKNFLEYIMRFGNLRSRKVMIEDARDVHYISADVLDKDIYAFNCQNGVYDLKNFTFKSHSPDDLMSKISNVVYEPGAKSPLWEKFMDDIMQGNKNKIDYLQKTYGYSLTGDTREETCYIHYGSTTRNGKTTAEETIAFMMGGSSGYAMTATPETLAQKKNTDSRQASGDIARLKGCRFLQMSEPPKRMLLDVSKLKTLIGRDAITARHIYEQEIEFIPQFKLFMNTNYLPVVMDDTLFTSGRVNVVTFDRHFEPHEQDKTLKDRLKTSENMSGIFNWCVEGLKKFYAEGIPPSEVAAAIAEYRAHSDKMGNFMSECLEYTGKNSKAGEVYELYRIWCNSNGVCPENKGNFMNELRGKGILADLGTIGGKSVRNVVTGYEISDNTASDYADFYRARP